MAAIVYTFVVRDGGNPTTGLTPSFTTFKNAATGGNLASPAIAEVGGGHYRFTLNWDAPTYTGVDSIVMVVDGDASIVNLNERYITGRINRYDSFPSDVQTLLSAAIGKWEVITNQLKIYDHSDGITVVKTYDLYDSAGNPTSEYPARREPV